LANRSRHGVGFRSKEENAAWQHIKQVEQCLKVSTPRLEPDDRDVTGLLGEKKKDA
jgi:hypothetical protein